MWHSSFVDSSALTAIFLHFQSLLKLVAKYQITVLELGCRLILAHLTPPYDDAL
uniref:Uncharacterized protein n=1 Tax=Parascaris equorum TaxID=6256 RepID=A0A914RS09_PAREQ